MPPATGPPTAADDVIFDANTPGNITVTAGAVARSLDCSGGSGGAGPFTHSLLPNSQTLTLGTSSTNGSLSLKLVAGMTVGANFAVVFASTSGTQEQITTATKTVGTFTFNGVGGSWIFADAFTSSGNVVLTNGTLNNGGVTVSCSALSSNNTNSGRVLTCTGSWTLNITSGSPFNINASSGASPPRSPR